MPAAAQPAAHWSADGSLSARCDSNVPMAATDSDQRDRFGCVSA